MEDDSSLVIHEFIDKYDDSSFKMSKKARYNSKTKQKNLSKGDSDSPTKRKRKPKPADMPRRPLSAYNIFFKEQRALIIGKPISTESVSGISRPQLLAKDDSLQDKEEPTQNNFNRKKRAHRRTHGKISFSDLAKQIGAAWNSLPKEKREKYAKGAAKEKARYQEELRLYKIKKKEGEEGDICNGKTSDDNSAIQSTHIDKPAKRKTYRSDRYPKLPLVRPQTTTYTPSGLTIEFSQQKKQSSKLRGKRYIPKYTGTSPQEQHDSIYPLPLNFDPIHCHPSELVNDRDMMKAVSPLLNRNNFSPKQVVCTSHHQNDDKMKFEKISTPSIQSSPSPPSPPPPPSHSSINSHHKANMNDDMGTDNEMADILSFFLKDGDIERQYKPKTGTNTYNEVSFETFAI